MATKVLIIEDNPTNLELMSYLLSQYGYDIISASDGKSGLDLAFKEKPDLIICDIQLPVLDGYQVIEQLKKDPLLVKTPAVAVTAFAMVGDRNKILSAGYDGYIDKPIDPQTFVLQLESFLPEEKWATGNKLSQSTTANITTGDSSRFQLEGLTLVIDDSPSDRDLLKTLLISVGLSVMTAENPKQGLALLERHLPDLILVDYHLPGINGAKLIKQIKETELFKNIPVVLLSSSLLSVDERKEIHNASIENVILRPIEPTKFLEIMAQLLKKAKEQ